MWPTVEPARKLNAVTKCRLLFRWSGVSAASSAAMRSARSAASAALRAWLSALRCSYGARLCSPIFSPVARRQGAQWIPDNAAARLQCRRATKPPAMR